MPELLKNIYNPSFFDRFTRTLSTVISRFDKKSFLKDIYDTEWENRELKQRMRHISTTLHAHLPGSFKKQTAGILKIIQQNQNGDTELGFEYMIFPDFIEVFGLDDYDTSVKAIEKITQVTSCEFAVRPFIIRYPKKMISQMKEWSKHQHPMVRRLSSEGCRPRLPWAMALPELKKDPAPILPILKRLKNDPSETVRRSVANNLNDISKDHPDIVIEMAKKWHGKTKETDWLVKHACRTLLKQGHPEAMLLFGFGSVEQIDIIGFKILTPEVKIGESMAFSFDLVNKSKKPSKIRLEYGLDFQKANGRLSKKVFTISEKEYPALSTTTINRKQPFKIITTRKLYPGRHQVSVIINGKELESNDFELL